MVNDDSGKPRRRLLDVYADGPFLIDRGIFLAPLFAAWALFARKPEFSPDAALLWMFCYAYCAPWHAYAAYRRSPPVDYLLVGAFLGWASTPWALFWPFDAFLSRPDIVGWAVLAAMVPGAVALLAVVIDWRPRPSLWRRVVIRGAGLIYLGWIAAYGCAVIAVVAPEATDGLLPEGSWFPALFAVIFGLPVPFMAFWMARRLLTSPLMTAEPEQAPG